METLHHAIRALRLRPRFTFVVVSVLGLCIGGMAATLSAAKVILFQELPYPQADQLVVLQLLNREDGGDYELSYAETADWRRRATTLAGVTPYMDWQDRVLTHESLAERIEVNYSAPDYLRMLGARVERGRLFLAEEDRAALSAPVIILSHALWARTFAEDPAILGKKVQVNNRPYTVVGVMSRHFADFSHDHRPDAFIPAVQAGEAFRGRGERFLSDRADRDWDVLARLKPGVTLAHAEAEVESIARQFQKEFPEDYRGFDAHLIPLRKQLFRDLYPGMRILLAGAIVVLLIGCANVANLMLVRHAEQTRQLAMRRALGATGWTLMRSVLVESLLLAAAGGVLGTGIAAVGTRLLGNVVALPADLSIHLDPSLLGWTLLVTAATGILCGLPPAISVIRMDVGRGLLSGSTAAGSRTFSGRRHSAPVIAQVAIVTALVLVAGLLLHSFWQLHHAATGFRADHLLTVRLRFAPPRYQEPGSMAIAGQQLIAEVGALPGVQGAALWGPFIPSISAPYCELKREGAPATDHALISNYHVISDGALEQLGVPLLRGREFSSRDRIGSQRVAIIAQGIARALWPGQDPLGRRLHMSDREDPWATVIGVIPDSHFGGRQWPGKLNYLLAESQIGSPNTNLFVRTSVAPASVAPLVRQTLKRFDPMVPVYDVSTMDERLSRQEVGQRLNATVTAVFAGLALLLAATGLHGLLAAQVLHRRHEIAVRRALGALGREVLLRVVTRSLAIVGIGLAIGILGAVALGRLIAGELFDVQPVDPMTLSAVVLVFLGLAVLSSALPARRALAVEASVLLRGD